MRGLPTALLLLMLAPAAAWADVKVEDPSVYHMAGLDYMREEKWNLAVDQLEKSLSIKNDDFRVWIDYGDALCVDARGVRYGTPERNEQAARAYRRATELHPGSARAWNNLAWLRAKTGTALDEALEAARRAVEIDGSRAGYLDTLAEVHFVRGELPMALRAIRRALEIQPGDEYYAKQLDRFEAASRGAAASVESGRPPGNKPKRGPKKLAPRNPNR